MFKAAYTKGFYRALRDALHAEVNAWNTHGRAEADSARRHEIWARVAALEKTSRRPDPTLLPVLACSEVGS